MLEIASPAKRAAKELVQNTIEKITSVAQEHREINLINVPEIIIENHKGAPLYKNLDSLDFASILQGTSGTKNVPNKVTAHTSTLALEKWIEKLIKNELTHAVFVGGNSSAAKYPGISVIEANKLGQAAGIIVGNISIPQRKNEVERLIEKTKSGCSFFTTQVLFEVKTIKETLQQYEQKCKENQIQPAEFFLSFSPVSDHLDLEYLTWLGALIPSETEALLMQSNAGNKSIELIKEMYLDVSNYVETNGLEIPLSINIAPIYFKNLNLSVQCLEVLKTQHAFNI